MVKKKESKKKIQRNLMRDLGFSEKEIKEVVSE